MAATAEVSPTLHTTFYAEASKNKTKSFLLAVFVIAILSLLIWIIAQVLSPGFSFGVLTFGGIFVIGYALVTYYYGDRVVLSTTNAKPLDPGASTKHLMVKNLVESIAISTRIPVPKIYVIESSEMNAFATGRDPAHASVAVTTALLQNLNRDELEGVLAHELSHVANYDVRFNTIVAVMVGLVAIMSDFFLRSQFYGLGRDRDRGRNVGILIIVGLILAIVAPIVTRLVQAAVSRKREALADAYGAEMTRNPDGLADALEKIGGANKGNMPVDEALSHLFFVDPVFTSLDKLFATHPPIQERIKLLRAMV